MQFSTNTIDLYRTQSRGQYDTDYSFMNYNMPFPSREVIARQAVYRFRYKQFNGSYAKNKKLLAFINGQEQEINYKIIALNYFKLLSNKMTDLVFNNEITVRSGDIQRDKAIIALIEKTGWVNEIRKAFKLATVYGDSCIKTYKDGLSAFAPLTSFKIVDKHNKSNTLGYCLYEFLTEKNYLGTDHITHIRFEVHLKGKIFEQVKNYIGTYTSGTIGTACNMEYNGRTISAEGNWYDTGVDDCELIQWLTINQEADGVYGESVYQDIQDVVFAMEQRISCENHTLNNLQEPFLIVGLDMVRIDDNGNYHLKLTDQKYMVQAGDGSTKPEFITPDYKLENSEKMLDILGGYFYELSEMGKTFLSGEYAGNISEETLNNTIKSAIDKGNRLINEMYYAFRDSLYCLCKLNGIELTKEDINIDFNVGRTDDDMKVAQICESLTVNKILSKSTVREKYFGYNKEQSDEEDRQIRAENGESSEQLVSNDELTNEDKENLDENLNIENKEEQTNDRQRNHQED